MFACNPPLRGAHHQRVQLHGAPVLWCPVSMRRPWHRGTIPRHLSGASRFFWSKRTCLGGPSSNLVTKIHQENLCKDVLSQVGLSFLVSRIGCFSFDIELPVSLGEGVLETDLCKDVPQQQGWCSFSPFFWFGRGIPAILPLHWPDANLILPSFLTCAVPLCHPVPVRWGIVSCAMMAPKRGGYTLTAQTKDKAPFLQSPGWKAKTQTTSNANSRADSLCFVGTMRRPWMMVPKKAFHSLFLCSVLHFYTFVLWFELAKLCWLC